MVNNDFNTLRVLRNFDVDYISGLAAVLDINKSVELDYSCYDFFIKGFAKCENYICYAELEGKIVGYAKMIPLIRKTYYLSSIVVHKDYQRKKIGTALLMKIIEQAKILNANRLIADYDNLECLSNFYEKDWTEHGYTKEEFISDENELTIKRCEKNRITYILQKDDDIAAISNLLANQNFIKPAQRLLI